jgi:hypothetical protein
MLERYLKMPQNSIAYFQELRLSSARIDYFQQLGGAFVRIIFQKLWIRWVRGLLAGIMLTR